MVCVNLTVGGADCPDITAVTVTAEISHNWIGDLVLKLVHPDNTTVTLMNRPGYAEGVDNGMDTSLEGSNLVAGYPVTFATGAPTSAENMGSTIENVDRVCQDDGLCTYAPAAGSAGGPDLTGLNGKATNGTWKFCAGDALTGDVGTLRQVTLTISR